MFDITLLAREYAPNSSGPKPLARKRMIKIIEIVVRREVIVVITTFFRNGLNLMLNIYLMNIFAGRAGAKLGWISKVYLLCAFTFFLLTNLNYSRVEIATDARPGP